MSPSECIQAASELLSRMDTKADPCEDFYQVNIINMRRYETNIYFTSSPVEDTLKIL